MPRTKEHYNLTKYKDNYQTIKKGLDRFSSSLFEFLSYEQSKISEKGLRNLLSSFGVLRQNIYSNSRKNKELYFITVNALDNHFNYFKKINVRRKKNSI